MNILITGASRGLGRALAEESRRRGHHVWGLARTMPAEAGERMHFSICDVALPDDVERVYREMHDAGFVPDAVILNAAVIKNDFNRGIHIEVVRESFQTNILGHIHLMSLMLPIFRKNPKGGIFVNISSLSSFRAIVKGKLAYPATKAAMDMFFESLRLQSPKGKITFSTVNLGPLSEHGPIPLLTATYRTAARRILRHIDSSNPNRGFSYPIGAAAIYRLARLAPDSLIRFILGRIGKDARKPSSEA